MSPSRPFILRPVATSLFMAAILLVGIVAYQQLPVSALPEVDFPTIQVVTFYPGASPDVVASAIGQAVEVQVGRCEPGVGDRVDLRAELTLDLSETGAGEKLRTPGGRGREQFACVVEQRRYFLFPGQGPPPV